MTDKIYEKVKLFSDLEQEELEKIKSIADRREYKKGEVIFCEGDPGDSMYLIQEGRVRLSHSVALDMEKTLLVLEEGSLFGEMALIGIGNRSAKATVEDDSILLAFHQEIFHHLIQKEKDLGIKLLKQILQVLIERLRITTGSYFQSIAWCMDISGASSLNLDKITKDRMEIELICQGDQKIKGRILKVEKSIAGVEIILRDTYGKIVMVPYHAIICMDIGYDQLTGMI
ncbi:MAG: cyclic nucleotide-binding domain-containing protein [Candidatus Brocadiae bacterium]|nr:cyclic nucleotide-binding domain-containing protein [Candidatus Brocadiia bacterium]